MNSWFLGACPGTRVLQSTPFKTFEGLIRVWKIISLMDKGFCLMLRSPDWQDQAACMIALQATELSNHVQNSLLSIVLTSVYRYYKYCLYRHCSPKDQQMERRDREGNSTLMKRMQLFWKELFVIIQIQMEVQQKTALLKHFPRMSI